MTKYTELVARLRARVIYFTGLRNTELDTEAADAIEAQQAKIDALMLEFCPNEMTPEQVENWGKHQVPQTPSGLPSDIAKNTAIRATDTGEAK